MVTCLSVYLLNWGVNTMFRSILSQNRFRGIYECRDKAETLKFLNERGISLSDDQLEELRSICSGESSGLMDNLNEECLKNVCGGGGPEKKTSQKKKNYNVSVGTGGKYAIDPDLPGPKCPKGILHGSRQITFVDVVDEEEKNTYKQLEDGKFIDDKGNTYEFDKNGKFVDKDGEFVDKDGKHYIDGEISIKDGTQIIVYEGHIFESKFIPPKDENEDENEVKKGKWSSYEPVNVKGDAVQKSPLEWAREVYNNPFIKIIEGENGDFTVEQDFAAMMPYMDEKGNIDPIKLKNVEPVNGHPIIQHERTPGDVARFEKAYAGKGPSEIEPATIDPAMMNPLMVNPLMVNPADGFSSSLNSNLKTAFDHLERHCESTGCTKVENDFFAAYRAGDLDSAKQAMKGYIDTKEPNFEIAQSMAKLLYISQFSQRKYSSQELEKLKLTDDSVKTMRNFSKEFEDAVSDFTDKCFPKKYDKAKAKAEAEKLFRPLSILMLQNSLPNLTDAQLYALMSKEQKDELGNLMGSHELTSSLSHEGFIEKNVLGLCLMGEFVINPKGKLQWKVDMEQAKIAVSKIYEVNGILSYHISMWEREAKALGDKIKELTDDIKKLNESKKKMGDDIEKLKKNIEDLNGQKKNTKHGDEKEKQIKDLNKQIKDLNKQIEDLNKQLKAKEKLLGANEKQLESFQNVAGEDGKYREIKTIVRRLAGFGDIDGAKEQLRRVGRQFGVKILSEEKEFLDEMEDEKVKLGVTKHSTEEEKNKEEFIGKMNTARSKYNLAFNRRKELFGEEGGEEGRYKKFFDTDIDKFDGYDDLRKEVESRKKEFMEKEKECEKLETYYYELCSVRNYFKILLKSYKGLLPKKIINECKSKVDNIKEQIEALTKQLEEYGRSLDEFFNDMNDKLQAKKQEEVKQKNAELERKKKEFTEAQRTLTRAQEELGKKNEELGGAQRQLEEARTQLVQENERLAEARKQVADARKQIKDAKEDAEKQKDIAGWARDGKNEYMEKYQENEQMLKQQKEANTVLVNENGHLKQQQDLNEKRVKWHTLKRVSIVSSLSAAVCTAAAVAGSILGFVGTVLVPFTFGAGLLAFLVCGIVSAIKESTYRAKLTDLDNRYDLTERMRNAVNANDDN